MQIMNKTFDIVEEKSIKNSFVYIKNYDINMQSYESKILLEENIDDVLKLQIEYESDSRVLKYDVSNTISMEEYLKTNKLKFNNICFIISELDKIITNIENYLISENSISLDLKLIRIDTNTKKIKFIILPNCDLDFSYELSKFLIRMLRFVDINDKKAIDLAYALFIKSSKENYTLNDLLSIINEKGVSKNDFDVQKSDFENYDDNLAYVYKENENNMVDYGYQTFENAINEYENDKNDENCELENNTNLMENDLNIKKNNVNETSGGGIFADDNTKKIIENELFSSFDSPKENKIINIFKNNKTKKVLKAQIKNNIFATCLIPIMSLLFIFLFYIVYGKNQFVICLPFIIAYIIVLNILAILNNFRNIKNE